MHEGADVSPPPLFISAPWPQTLCGPMQRFLSSCSWWSLPSSWSVKCLACSCRGWLSLISPLVCLSMRESERARAHPHASACRRMQNQTPYLPREREREKHAYKHTHQISAEAASSPRWASHGCYTRFTLWWQNTSFIRSLEDIGMLTIYIYHTHRVLFTSSRHLFLKLSRLHRCIRYKNTCIFKLGLDIPRSWCAFLSLDFVPVRLCFGV